MKGKQGFASMSPERVRELGRKGGSVKNSFTANRGFATSGLAKVAGKKGGQNSPQKHKIGEYNKAWRERNKNGDSA